MTNDGEKSIKAIKEKIIATGTKQDVQISPAKITSV
jgi:hypothetical protein